MKSHIENEAEPIEAIVTELTELSTSLDHRHRQQRKLQFFLDVRGYFVANRITGAYAEFGVYRGEMMWGAHHVLDATGCFACYVGFDSFSGEPAYSSAEQAENPYLKPGDFASDYEVTKGFLAKYLGEKKLLLIKGDFREAVVLAQGDVAGKLALAAIDCNISSSIRSSLEWVLPRMQKGAFLFLDDYFANLGGGGFVTDEILKAAADRHKRELVPYKTYPPCARAFITL